MPPALLARALHYCRFPAANVTTLAQPPRRAETRDAGISSQCRLESLARAALHPNRTRERKPVLAPACRCPTERAAGSSIGRRRHRGTAEGELPNRPLDVKFDVGHFREQLEISDADRAAAQPHIGRHQVEGLHQHAGILQNQ